jgi:tetratricopeptide (TPR) repeat protein
MVDFCNNEEWLAAYLDRRLGDDERREYERHIAVCPRCLTALLSASRELDEIAGILEANPGPAQNGAGTIAGNTSPPVPFSHHRILAGIDTVKRATAGYAAVGAAIAIAAVLISVFLSPSWDPDLRDVSDEITHIVSTARIGPLRLSGGRKIPAGIPVPVRGGYLPQDSRSINHLEGELNDLLRRYPGNSEVYYLLGHLHLSANRFDRAETAYRRAHRGAPDDGRALNNLAVIAFRRGETGLALDRLIDAIHHRQAPVEAYYNLCILYHEAGKPVEARRHLDAYLRREDSSPWADRARSIIGQ